MSLVVLDRRTLDGRLCAAAFVQNRQAFTGCADVPNPDGVSGRPWCYVEAQVPIPFAQMVMAVSHMVMHFSCL